jgi:hypothetical protein
MAFPIFFASPFKSVATISHSFLISQPIPSQVEGDHTLFKQAAMGFLPFDGIYFN